MKAHYQHRKHHVANAILSSVNPETFTPTRLTAKALNEDSCWDEYESDFEECIPSHLLSSIEDSDFS
jgi:hypothetical protein